MPARFKDFGSPVSPGASSDEPIIFKLYGDVFRCRPMVQGRTLIKLITLANQQNMADSATAIVEFFDHALVEEDKQAFVDLCESEDKLVPIETMAEIMEFLVENYGNSQANDEGASAVDRPTEPSSVSSSGDVPIGPPLMEGQYAPVAVSSN